MMTLPIHSSLLPGFETSTLVQQATGVTLTGFDFGKQNVGQTWLMLGEPFVLTKGSKLANGKQRSLPSR